jgi:lysophospholipase L1-like esterase
MNTKMLVYGAGVVLVLIAFYFFIGRDSARDIVNYPPKNHTIVAFGDSLVYGTGARDGNGFVSLLSQKLSLPIENLGVPGDTTESGILRIEDVIDRDPGTVLLLLGGNDYLKRIPEETTKQNLGTIIRTFQNNGSVVILLGVRGGILRDSRGAMFEELSEEYGTGYVSNVLDGLVGNTEYMDDAIHPNDAGHALIAERIYEEMAQLGYVSAP